MDTAASKKELAFQISKRPTLGADQPLCLAAGIYRANAGTLGAAATEVGVVAYRLP